MKISKKMLLPVVAVCLAFSILVGTFYLRSITVAASDTEDKTVAHGITLKADGSFDFTINGKAYKNEYERILDEDGFIYGIDYNRFGNFSQLVQGMGYNEVTGVRCPYKPEYVERCLYNLKALGFTAINSWILNGGSGFTYDENGLVTGLGDLFVEQLTELLESCRRVGMDLVPTILVHGWSGIHNEVRNGLTPNEIRLKYFRYYYDQTARDAYIENGVKEVCEILSKYQDVIPIVNLTVENGSQTNDLENGMIFNNEGVIWEDFATLLNTLHDTSKEYMPDIPTSVEDMAWAINGFKYNDLKVDIIGFNYYSVKNNPNLESRFQQRPAYLGEMNVADASQVDTANSYSDAVLNAARVGHFRRAVEGGFLGAFFFSVHSMAPARNSNLFAEYRTDDYSLLQNYATDLSYAISDLKNEYKGITTTMDKPVMLYNFDSDTNYWVGGRGVKHFILERSDNGGEWKVIADNIDSMLNAMDNGLVKWVDDTRVSGVKYRYRVTAVDYDGNKITSDPSNVSEVFDPVELFVDADGNYAGGFEDGEYKATYPAASTMENSNGWYRHGSSSGEFTTEEARTGNYSFKIDHENGIGTPGQYSSFMRYNLKVESGKTYKFSLWYKTKRGKISITVRNTETNKNLCAPSIVDTVEEDLEWQYVQTDFVAPDSGLIQVVIMNNSTTINNTKLYIDDMSITEFR